MYDGSVAVSTALDNTQLERDLKNLPKEIEKAGKAVEGERSINFSMNVSDAEKRLSELRCSIEETEKKLETFTGDVASEEFKYLTASLEDMKEEWGRVASSSDEAFNFAMGRPKSGVVKYTDVFKGGVEEINRYLEDGTDALMKNADAISERLNAAVTKLKGLEEQGFGLGYKEYDDAYRQFALLVAEAKKYQKELAKTPEQVEKEAEAAQKKAAIEAQAAERAREAEEKRQQRIANEAAAAIARQEAEQHLLDIKENAVVADQRVVDLQKELASLAARRKELEAAGVGIGYEEYDQILQRTQEINGELREYQNNLVKIEGETGEVVSRTGKIPGWLDKLTNRLKKLASRAFVFTMITTALRSLRTWMGKAIKTNDEARQSIAQLKGALLTLAQPLVEVVIPAFVTLVNVLARIITAVAQLVSMLFGKTLKQSKDGAKALYEEANAIEGVGAAADEAAGSLAGFDEINTINTENAGGGGGGGADETIAPEFGDVLDSGMLDRLKEIADLVALIGAGLALWKLSGMLPGVLGTIAQKLAGIMLTVGGLLLLWNGLTDAWENGVDWFNLIEMIGGLAAAAFGLYLLFGPIAAGIMLIVGGLALLVTGFHDAMENGWNLQNTLLSIAGILGAGLGIALITGSWIPLLVAGIASVLLALAVATGHGEELIEGIRKVLEGFSDFFTGIFSGDIEKTVGGIEKIFEGLKMSVFAIVDGVKDTLLSFLDWLDEKTGGRFHGIIEGAKEIVTGFFDNVKTTISGWIDGAKTALQGLVKFLMGVFTLDWDAAWEGIKDIFKGVWNSNISLLEGAVNLIIKGLNWLISQMNKIKFDVPSWVPGVGGRSLGINIPSISEVQIPRLAQGAVIPPNREFMAVLGDQSSGNNLEAPEALIRKIVREESGGGSAELMQLLQAILTAVKEGHIIMVDGQTFGRTAIKTINSVNTTAGKQLLLI